MRWSGALLTEANVEGGHRCDFSPWAGNIQTWGLDWCQPTAVKAGRMFGAALAITCASVTFPHAKQSRPTSLDPACRVAHNSGMRMLAATLLIAVSLLSAAAVAACVGPSSSRQFSAVLQLSEESQRLPIVLSDETGLVTAIESVPMDPGANYAELAAKADPTNPNAFIVRWLGGACDNDASLRFYRAEGVYVVNVALHGNVGFGGCPAVGIPRDIRIVTSSPIPVDSIVAAGAT